LASGAEATEIIIATVMTIAALVRRSTNTIAGCTAAGTSTMATER